MVLCTRVFACSRRGIGIVHGPAARTVTAGRANPSQDHSSLPTRCSGVSCRNMVWDVLRHLVSVVGKQFLMLHNPGCAANPQGVFPTSRLEVRSDITWTRPASSGHLSLSAQIQMTTINLPAFIAILLKRAHWLGHIVCFTRVLQPALCANTCCWAQRQITGTVYHSPSVLMLATAAAACRPTTAGPDRGQNISAQLN